MSEDNEIDEKTEKDDTNTLRKYVTSPLTLVLFALVVFASWKYTFTSINYIGFAVVAITAFTIGFFPVRITSHFVVNEFTLDDFVVVLGFFWLDPFQFAFAFALGKICQHIIYKYPLRRIYVNAYCDFYICVVPAAILQSPFHTNSKYFFPVMAFGLFGFYLVDTISFYVVCNFKFRENLMNLKSEIKFISMGLGLILGVPTCILIEERPLYAPILFIIFGIGLSISKKQSTLSVQKNQLEEIVNFMNDISNLNTIEKSKDRLLEMTMKTFKHNGVYLTENKPDGDKQLGHEIFSENGISYWLVVDKSDFSNKRLKQDIVLLENIANAAKNVFEHRKIREQLFSAASHDFLRGLANRSSLEEYVNHELGLVKRNKTSFALMFIDIDDFKPVNDIHGHKAGDELLKCIARRLSLTVRTQDVVARIGGDEFAILCRDIETKEAEELALRITLEIAKPVFLDDLNDTERVEVFVNSSIGISSAPDDGITFENLLRTADERMYRAKKSKKNVRIVSADKKTETRSA